MVDEFVRVSDSLVNAKSEWHIATVTEMVEIQKKLGVQKINGNYFVDKYEGENEGLVVKLLFIDERSQTNLYMARPESSSAPFFLVK